MKHLSDDQIMRIAKCYSEYLPYSKEDLEGIEHIGECDKCYNAFCCAVVVYEAISEEALSSIFPSVAPETIEAELNALEPSCPLAVIRVFIEKVSDTVMVKMNQINNALSSWAFSPSMAMVGARGASEEENTTIAVVEKEDSKFTTIRFDALTGHLTVNIDTVEAESIPIAVVIRYHNGVEQEYEMTENGRFLVVEIDGIEGDAFEVILK